MNFFRLTLLALFVLNYSCSTNNETNTTDTDKKINTNITSIRYPQNTGVYSRDITVLEYNEFNQIKKITGFGVYEVEYVSANLIELNLVEEYVSNADIESKIIINLSDDKVKNIITKRRVQTSSYTTYYKDSTSYIYKNDYPYKIENYWKTSDIDPIPSEYKITESKLFTIENGNITKVITNEYGTIKTSEYTYDDKPHIEFGEFTYEMPLSSNFIHTLMHDKFGKKNSNNIISLINHFENPNDIRHDFLTMNYSRKVDKHNRLKSISISGTAIVTHKKPEEEFTFTDIGIFEY